MAEQNLDILTDRVTDLMIRAKVGETMSRLVQQVKRKMSANSRQKAGIK